MTGFGRCKTLSKLNYYDISLLPSIPNLPTFTSALVKFVIYKMLQNGP